jgi:lysophospholipase L1-like esterase
MIQRGRFAFILFLILCCGMARAENKTPAILRGVHRIVFLGDSITQAGDYVVDIECWCLAHGLHPDIVNVGLASETATDLTAPENEWHRKTFGFGRPFVSERLSRVLQETKPDLLLACYGMNDATGLPATDQGLQRYEAAIATLRETALRSGVKRVLLCTPPIFDNKAAYADNATDHVLKSFSDWLVSKRKDHWLVADIHTPMRQALEDRRAADPKFQFASDGVHPDRAGHWVMAQAVLNDAFNAHLADVPSSEALFHSQGVRIRELVRQKQDLLFNAYMSKIGHHRPGVPGGPGAAPGPSIEDARLQATGIDKQIDDLLK